MLCRANTSKYNSITLNKNAVHGDVSALQPGGVRIGAPALTSRSFKEDDFRKIGEFLHKTAQIGLRIQATSGKMLKDFVNALEGDSEVKVYSHCLRQGTFFADPLLIEILISRLCDQRLKSLLNHFQCLDLIPRASKSKMVIR